MVARDARVWDPAVARVRRFCDQRVPAEARDQVRLEVRIWASTITIVEHRPLWQGGRVRGPACRSPNFVTTLPRAPGPCTGRIATDAGIATTTSTPPSSSTSSSRRSTRTPSPSSGDSTAPLKSSNQAPARDEANDRRAMPQVPLPWEGTSRPLAAALRSASRRTVGMPGSRSVSDRGRRTSLERRATWLPWDCLFDWRPSQGTRPR